MVWSRAARSGADDDRVQGLREERKALAVRYTIDVDEARRREELTSEVTTQQLGTGEGPGRAAAASEPAVSPRRDRVSPRRGPKATGSVIGKRSSRAAAKAEPKISPRQDVVSPRRDPGAARYVIELRATGFLWRWAIFDLSVGDDGSAPPQALRSLQAVTMGALPRLSERSAKRAAERAAREAYASETVGARKGSTLLRLLHSERA
jgi:hypothetical protein